MDKQVKEIDIVTTSGEVKDVEQYDMTGFNPSKAEKLLGDVVVMYQANQKNHTACVKGRSEVACTGRKQRKQKGTGSARAGSGASPIWVGGGVAFGPRPRHVRYRLPKKIKAKALKEAINMKISQNELKIVDHFEIEAAKTKVVSSWLKAMDIKNRFLLITKEMNPKLVLSTRNIQKSKVLPCKDLNALEILKARTIVIEKEAFDEIQKRFVA